MYLSFVPTHKRTISSSYRRVSLFNYHLFFDFHHVWDQQHKSISRSESRSRSRRNHTNKELCRTATTTGIAGSARRELGIPPNLWLADWPEWLYSQTQDLPVNILRWCKSPMVDSFCSVFVLNSVLKLSKWKIWWLGFGVLRFSFGLNLCVWLNLWLRISVDKMCEKGIHICRCMEK